MAAPTEDDLASVARALGISRRDLDAFVEAWDRAGRPEPLDAFLGVPQQRQPDHDIRSA
jgi:hypothetical protein